MCISNYIQQKDQLVEQLNTADVDRRQEIIDLIAEIVELMNQHRHPNYDVPHLFNLNTCCGCCLIDNHATVLDLWGEMYRSQSDFNQRIDTELYQKIVDEIEDYYSVHPVTEMFVPEIMHRICMFSMAARIGQDS